MSAYTDFSTAVLMVAADISTLISDVAAAQLAENAMQALGTPRTNMGRPFEDEKLFDQLKADILQDARHVSVFSVWPRVIGRDSPLPSGDD